MTKKEKALVDEMENMILDQGYIHKLPEIEFLQKLNNIIWKLKFPALKIDIIPE